MKKLSKKQLDLKKRVLKDLGKTIDVYMDGTKYKDEEELLESLTYDSLCTLLSIYGLERVNGTIRQAMGCHVQQMTDELIEHPEFFVNPLEVSKALAKVVDEIEMLEDFDQIPCRDGVCNDCKAKEEAAAKAKTKGEIVN
jgi:hypothetical protein